MASISQLLYMTFFNDERVGRAESLLMAMAVLLPVSSLIPIELTESAMPKEVKVLMFACSLCLAFSSGQQAKAASAMPAAARLTAPRNRKNVVAKAKPVAKNSKTVKYGTLMVEYERKDPEKTIEVFNQARLEGVPLERYAWNAVLCANQHLARADDALSVFEQMLEHCSPNAKTYGALIGACASDCRAQLAIHYYQVMLQKGFTANRFTYHDVITSYLIMNMFGAALAVYEETKKNAVIPSGCTFKLLIRACKRRRLTSMALQFEEELSQAKQIDKSLSQMYMAQINKRQQALLNMADKMPALPDDSMLEKVESTTAPHTEVDEASTTDVDDSHDQESE